LDYWHDELFDGLILKGVLVMMLEVACKSGVIGNACGFYISL
jgi:hypothetical protein